MLRGRLEDLSLADMCLLVWNARETGVLSITSDGGGGAIHFVDGWVRHAESYRVRVGYARELIAAGALSSSRLRTVLDECTASGRQPEKVLVEEGIPAEFLAAAALRTVSAALVDLLTWTRGWFEFQSGATMDGIWPCALPR